MALKIVFEVPPGALSTLLDHTIVKLLVLCKRQSRPLNIVSYIGSQPASARQVVGVSITLFGYEPVVHVGAVGIDQVQVADSKQELEHVLAEVCALTVGTMRDELFVSMET